MVQFHDDEVSVEQGDHASEAPGPEAQDEKKAMEALVAKKGQANQDQVGLVEVQLLLGEVVVDDEDHDEAPHLCVEIELQLVQLQHHYC